MQREDFIFTVGFQGNTAVVDKKARRKFSKFSAGQLFEQGLYRAAFCAALYDNDSAAIDQLLQHFNALGGTNYQSVEYLKRLFGVDSVPENVSRTRAL